jgi:hypothetical protein
VIVGCEGRKLLIAPQHPRKTKHGLESLLHGISESLNSADRALILVSQQNKNGLKSQVSSIPERRKWFGDDSGSLRKGRFGLKSIIPGISED